MRMQKPKNDTMDFKDSWGKGGRELGVKDYKLCAVYTTRVMGAPKSHKSPLQNLPM